MSKKSFEKKQTQLAEKAAARRAIEQQYELNPGQLEPRPLNHLGRFTFTSRKQQSQTRNAIRFIPKPESLR